MSYAIHGQKISFDDTDISIIYSAEPLSNSKGNLTQLLAGDSAPVCNPTFLELRRPLFRPEEIFKSP